MSGPRGLWSWLPLAAVALGPGGGWADPPAKAVDPDEELLEFLGTVDSTADASTQPDDESWIEYLSQTDIDGAASGHAVSGKPVADKAVAGKPVAGKPVAGKPEPGNVARGKGVEGNGARANADSSSETPAQPGARRSEVDASGSEAKPGAPKVKSDDQ